MQSFHDVRFPTAISFGATGGPERRNEIVLLTSGQERRNARFAQSRRHYDVGTGIRSLEDLEDVIAFFEARRGSLHAFRFRDPFDMKSCRPAGTPGALDQPLGVAGAGQVVFQLAKTYGSGAGAYRRLISKPVPGSVTVAVNGAVQSSPAQYTVNSLTGLVTFQPSALPPAGASVTAGYEFEVPVRFDAERIEVGLTAFKAGQIPTIPLVEVLA